MVRRIGQGPLRFLRNRALTSAATLCLVAEAFAGTGNVSVAPLPDWVRPCDWSAPARGEKSEKSEGTRYLLYERQENPQREEKFIRIIQLMENETGVQDSGSVTFGFDPAFQELILHQVRIYRDGKPLERLEQSKIKIIQPEPELDGHLFTGQQTALVFVEDLRVGDALEYAYTVRGVNPLLKGHYSARFVLQSSEPVDRQRVRMVWSSAKPLRLRQSAAAAAPKKAQLPDGATEYVWDLANLDAIPFEDHLPIAYEPYPCVEVTDFDDWARVVEWALPLYAAENTNMPVELSELIGRWQRTGQSDEERARMALEFVQDQLRYTAIELGPDSYRPAHPFESFRLRYADCKGKASLLCAMLRAMKIEAYPALVNNSVAEAVADRLPSPFAFNHVIVQLQLAGRAVWVDPTLSHQGGSLWNRYLPPLGKALVVKPGVAALEDIPAPPAERTFQHITSTFTVNDYQSPVVLTVKTAYHGSDADDMREYFDRTDAKEIARKYLNFYARYYPGVQQPQPLEVDDDRASDILTVTEHYQIKDLWKPNESGRRLEAVFYAEGMEQVLTDPNTRLRKMPLRMSYPLRRQQDVIVHLPDRDWNISGLEKAVEHDAFSFHYRRKYSDSTVRFEYECQTRTAQVSAEKVAGYLKKLDEMQDLLSDTLYRPNGSQKAGLAQVNWLMIVIAGFATIAVLAGSIRVWRVTRVAAASSSAVGPPPLPADWHLQGLGGWLILVGIGLCLGPLVRCANLLLNWEGFFSMQTWQAVALPESEQYHPLYTPLLIFELLCNVVLLGWNILAICLFFDRRRFFPRAYIGLLVFNAVFLLTDEIVGAAIPSVAAAATGSSKATLLRALVMSAIWIGYMLTSRRVKATFVR